MAFNAANLSHFDASGNGPVVWKYTTSDNLSVVEGGSYFAAAIGTLRQGDILEVTAGDGNRSYLVVDNTPSLQFEANVSSFR